jgi:hypothetical protein
VAGSCELSCKIKFRFPSKAGNVVNSWQTSGIAKRTLSCIVGFVYLNTLSSLSCIETYWNLHTALQIFSLRDKDVALLDLLYGSVLQNSNICANLVIKSDFSRNACIWKQGWNKLFQIYFLLKNKKVTNIYKKYFIFGDLKQKYPAPIIHKDGQTNKMRLRTTKITFIYFNLIGVFLYSRGNRPRNSRVCLAQFGHHRCTERK